MRRSILSGALLIFFASPALFSECGGTERWQVKVGADSGVDRVQLSPLIPKTIADLNVMFEPERPSQHDNDTRFDEELQTFEVNGWLVRFKHEAGATGDRDYHLVVSDDSLKFTANNGSNIGHSVVAEIIDPDCIPGKRGDPAVPSRFIDKIRSVRTKFETKFPNISSDSWVDAGGIPVRIVGIGFFDRPHGQVGRAANNLEIHPVLEIDFDNIGVVPPPTMVSGNLIQNPGFEQGLVAWNGPADVITKSSVFPAQEGSWKALMCGYGESHADTLYQDVSIPANIASAKLSYFLRIDTDEAPQQAFDKLKLQIRKVDGTWLKTPATYSNLNANNAFEQRTVDLTAFKGLKIRINFLCEEDSRTITNFILDNVRLQVQ